MKIVKNVLRLLLGVVLGALVISFFGIRQELLRPLTAFFRSFGIELTRNRIPINTLAVWIGIFLLVGIVTILLLNRFANTKNMKKMLGITEIVSSIFIAIPLSGVLLGLLDLLVYYGVQGYVNGNNICILYLLIDMMIYAVLFESITETVVRSARKLYGKDKARCDLFIGRIGVGGEIEEVKSVFKHKKFTDCYACIQANKNGLNRGQIFAIREYNCFHTYEVAQWLYFNNGDIVECELSELARRLQQAEAADNISWGF